VSETSIKDKSMLGAHGEELCNNVDVHWIIQTCDVPKKETSKFACRLYINCALCDRGRPAIAGRYS